MVDVPLPWEQNFSGLEEWISTNPKKLEKYFAAAKKLEMRVAYKIKGKIARLYCEKDTDMGDLLQEVGVY